MNILYCGDSNIVDGLYISILSLLKNIKEELNISVLTVNVNTENLRIEGVSDHSIKFLDGLVKDSNSNSFVKKIDITDLFMKELPVINLETRFTPCCMLRLFADYIEELPDKILYLDNDVVIRKDFSEFYNQDISNYEICGVLDFYGKWFFRNKILKFDYINSGVLLLNLRKIRETRLFARCRKMCIEKEIFMPDQSSLNKLARYKKIMPRKYNDQRRLHKDTVIQHFTTTFRLFPWLHTLTVKPWDVERVHSILKNYEYDDILQTYLKNKDILKEGVKDEQTNNTYFHNN